MQTVRPDLRALVALTAVLLAAAGPLAVTVPAAQASASQSQRQEARTNSAVSQQPLAISITGMTPTTAGPNSTVTLYGTLGNHTGSALSGIAVQAWTSTQWFTSASQMTEFTSDPSAGTASLQPAGEQREVPGSVPNGATVRWTVSFSATDFYDQFGQFGVFPVEVQASTGTYTKAARTLLPFWPGGTAATQVKGLQTAWVWPLVDTPQQGACSQTLATSEKLASSVAPGGRLSTLLDAGATWARTDHLTWDIDPALLSDVSVMTKDYFTQGNATCTDRFSHQPSTAAAKWLSQLQTSTAGESAFLTPYANVDVAALSHSGLEGNIATAYQVGDTVAGQILPDTFGKTGTGTGDGAVLKAAWPADGEADLGVLTSLAADGGINTVVLSSDLLTSPTASGGEDALARAVNGEGASMSVLLANSRITSLLGTASASASEAGTFTFTQDFLAQTAMIAAESPSTSRSLVIAPPTGWDPSAAEANAVLSFTKTAPWLHSAGLSTLAAAAERQPSAIHVPAKQVSGAELSDAYLDHLAPVQVSLSVFRNLLYRPSASQLDSLATALATIESSAWRGRGSYGGWLAMSQLNAFLRDSEHKVVMIVSNKILLTGQSGETPVSVQNGLSWPIQVQVAATVPPGSHLQVGTADLPPVQGGGSGTVHVHLRSSATNGTTTVQLQLMTKDGSPLGTAKSLSVEVTRFGRLLLIIIGGALGILVLTSAYRLRRRRLAGGRNGGSADETADAGGAG
jgi:Family of unknown function (DUF6049)